MIKLHVTLSTGDFGSKEPCEYIKPTPFTPYTGLRLGLGFLRTKL